MDGTGFIINQLYNIIFVISLRKLICPHGHLTWFIWWSGKPSWMESGMPNSWLKEPRLQFYELTLHSCLSIELFKLNIYYYAIRNMHILIYSTVFLLIICESHHVYASEIHKNTPQQFKQIVHLNVLYIMSYTHVWTCAIAAVFILGN